MEITNKEAFVKQVITILKTELDPVFESAATNGHKKTKLSTPVATRTLLPALSRVSIAKSPTAIVSKSFGFLNINAGRKEALRRMQFGYKGLEAMTPELQAWLDAIGKPSWKTREFISVGFAPNSVYFGGNKNPLQKGLGTARNELQGKLNIKFS